MENNNSNTTTLSTFNFHGFGVRTVIKDNEPWFVAKDVAAVLGYRMASDMCRRLDDDERGTHFLRTLGGEQEITIINESGLYNAVLGSNKSNAREFRKWVTSEVLPAIRKTGGYIHARPEESPEEIMARAILVANDTINRLKNQLEQDKPKVLFADSVTASDSCITIGELAKLINQSSGFQTGEKRLFEWLRENGWLMKSGSSKNMPSQRGMERGFFVIHERIGQSGNGNPPILFKTTKVTGKGQRYFLEYFHRENPL